MFEVYLFCKLSLYVLQSKCNPISRFFTLHWEFSTVPCDSLAQSFFLDGLQLFVDFKGENRAKHVDF
jgi:hypothetical protein